MTALPIGRDTLMPSFERPRSKYPRSCGLEVRRWLVGEHHRGLLHERPRDGHPLLLSAAQLVWPMIAFVGEAD